MAFTRSGETWTQQGSKLTGTGETGEGGFGTSVALSGEGTTALIGAPNDNGVGAAFPFVLSEEGTWSQQGSKLTGTGAVKFPEFGTSVALSDDGNTALIGAPSDNGEVGAAWAFTRAGESWSQQGSKLLASDEVGGGRFGESVALSSNGNAGIIGGSGDHGESGAVWAFARSGESWVQAEPKLLGGTGAEEEVGDSVAVSANGTTVLAGARFSHAGAGAAYVYPERPARADSGHGLRLLDRGDLGDPERDREPERPGSDGMQVRIRPHGRLRKKRSLQPCRGGRRSAR